MSLDGISLALEIASRIEAQTDKSKKNKGKLRHLSLQALAVADDIREHYALLEKQNVVLPKSMVDTISQLELILGKILRVVEKEQSRTRFKSWLRASSQADKCMLLSEELAACAARFGMVANLHILGQTRVISVRQDQIAARDGELLRTLVTKSTSLPAVKQYQVVENVVGGASMVFCSGLDSSQREGHSHVDDFLIEERQGFEGFLGCLEQTLTTRCEVLSPLQETFTFFLQHLESRHQGLAICYAATETFVVEYADELKVCACVAVLKEDYDLRPNYDDRVGNFARCRKDFLFEFTLLTVTDTHTSPSDWIKVQGLANHFQRERIAYALWDLGRLPPASHIPDSDSFRWIRQRISTIPTVSGERVVVDVESGNDNYPFRRFHQLNARIAHPSNARCRLDLIQHLDNEIRLVCEETNEEWFISIISQERLIRSLDGRKRYIDAHRKYAFRGIELEIEAFESMGIHCPLSTRPKGQVMKGNMEKTFKEIQAAAARAIDALFLPLLERCSPNSARTPLILTMQHLDHCRTIGRAWWKIHTSIVLLSSEGREQSSAYTRIPLAKARSDLAHTSAPQPALIWNYVPPHMTAQARRKREQILNGLI